MVPATESECKLRSSVTQAGHAAVFIFPGVTYVTPVVNGLKAHQVSLIVHSLQDVLTPDTQQ